MPTDLQQVLNNIASSLHILPGVFPAEFGDPVHLKIAPAVSDLPLTDTVASLVNLTWLNKTVNYQDSQLLDAPLAGDPTAVPPQPSTIENNLGTLLPPVSGLFGQAEGMLPIPVQVPVTLTVAWKAFECPRVLKPPEPRGPGGVRSLASSSDVELTEGVHYVLPNGSSSPEVTFLFGLVSYQPMMCVKVVANVTVSALGRSASAAPEIKLLVPTLELPTVVFLFRRVDLNKPAARRHVLLAIPDTVAAPAFDLVMDKLRIVRDLASKVRQIRRFVRLVTGINLAISAVSRERTKPHFHQGNEIKNFTPSLRNVISSMIFIGAPDSWVDCYVHASGWEPTAPRWGHLRVGKTIALLAVIRNLYGNDPEAVPDSAAADSVEDSTDPEGFDDNLSSLRFHVVADDFDAAIGGVI